MTDIKEIDRPMFTTGKVHFYSICDVIDFVMPLYWNGYSKDSYTEMKKLTELFQKHNNMHFYSAPRENFSFIEAEKETLELNLTNCIVEDLS
jgi:hypothetical protein